MEVFTGRGLAVWRAGLEADVYSGSGLTTLLSAPLSYVELLGLAPGNPSQNKLFPPGGGGVFLSALVLQEGNEPTQNSPEITEAKTR